MRILVCSRWPDSLHSLYLFFFKQKTAYEMPKWEFRRVLFRSNINVGIHYLGSWLAGNGCVPIHNLMEDAATAEISRSQVWQWIRSTKGMLDDGRKITAELDRKSVVEGKMGTRPGARGLEQEIH